MDSKQAVPRQSGPTRRTADVLDRPDVLKYADFMTGVTDEFSSVAAYERIDRDVNFRAAVTRLVNGTFAARDIEWWGRGTETRVRRHHGRPAQGLRPRHRRRPSR
ncbi:hypothetical protein [Streptomyces sp. NPDC020817]|uniref:hypothetical protein n=1 Tax=Streptomyces sp. NPDC020817 TaxID=3365095 RepID=UPI0037ADA312